MHVVAMDDKLTFRFMESKVHVHESQCVLCYGGFLEESRCRTALSTTWVAPDTAHVHVTERTLERRAFTNS